MGRWSEALWDFLFSVTKGSGYLKGEQFEKWIETAFFPPDKYTLVHRTPNEPTNAVEVDHLFVKKWGGGKYTNYLIYLCQKYYNTRL